VASVWSASILHFWILRATFARIS